MKKKRSERIVGSARSIIDCMLPDEYKAASTDSPYKLECFSKGDHFVVDVYPISRDISGQIIGRHGVSISSIRKLLEIIANQEGLRLSLSVITPDKA